MSELILNDQQALKEEKINEFEQGLRPNNSLIGRYRDPNYANLKRLLNSRANGNVDLIFTGRTVSTLFVKPLNKGYVFGWDDKYNLLRYGLDILGINYEWFLKRQSEVYRFQLVKKIKTQNKIA